MKQGKSLFYNTITRSLILAVIFCHSSLCLANLSCRSLLSPVIDFDSSNKLSNLETRYTFFRGVREGATLLLNKDHIIPAVDFPLRVRNQCDNTCTFASTNLNLEALLKKRNIIEKEGTLLDLAILLTAMHPSYSPVEIYSSTSALNSVLNTGYSYSELLFFVSSKKLLYLNKDQVSQLGGYSNVTRLERSFINRLKKIFKIEEQKYSQLLKGDFAPFFENITQLFSSFLREKTGVNITFTNTELKASISISEIAFNEANSFHVRTTIPAYNPATDSKIFWSLSRSNIPLEESIKDDSLELGRALITSSPLSQSEYAENSITFNDDASYESDVLRPITRHLLNGNLVAASLKWTANEGFHTNRHAITLTGVVINPETRVFEGFTYQNSDSKLYGLLGTGFLSKKDFFESISYFEAVILN